MYILPAALNVEYCWRMQSDDLLKAFRSHYMRWFEKIYSYAFVIERFYKNSRKLTLCIVYITCSAKCWILLTNAVWCVVKSLYGLIIVKGLKQAFRIVHYPHLVERMSNFVGWKQIKISFRVIKIIEFQAGHIKK